MKLVVGLGNPGKKYEKTRHNVGFRSIDFYAEKNNLDFKKKFNGLYCEYKIKDNRIILLKPQTFMNLSGECVSKFIKYFNINLEDVIIIYDDIDFEVGKYKIKRNGSSAGHNGINSIIQLLKTEEIQRVRVGISKNNIPLESYVLQNFNEEDNKIIDSIMPELSNIIDDFSCNNIDYIMEKYNRN